MEHHPKSMFVRVDTKPEVNLVCSSEKNYTHLDNILHETVPKCPVQVELFILENIL